MADAATTVRDYLASHREAETRFLAELVKVPSDNPPGDCAAHAEAAARLLEGLGFTVERHKVPDETVRANGMISCTNLVVRKRFGEGAVVALNAHGDVVPPGEGWTRDPYGAEIVDGWMYGRGVAVSKSDFATYAFALLALEDAVAGGARLGGTVELHLTYDEEAGGDQQVGLGQALFEQPAGAEFAADLLVVGEVQLDGAFQRRAERFSPLVKAAQNVSRGLQRVDAGPGHGRVRRAAVDLHLQVQAAIVGGGDRVGEARTQRQVGVADALLEQPARADLAADLLVVGEVQLDRAAEPRTLGHGILQRQEREGVGGEVGLGDRDAAAVHPAVDDLGAVGLPGPALDGRDHVAMGVEGHHRPLAEPLAHDQVGAGDHAIGAHGLVRDLVPLDGEAEPL